MTKQSLPQSENTINIFNKLREINVNEHTEKKSNLTYLSWAWAWDIFKQNCPDAKYEIIKFNGRPFIYDENTGYMVFTKVTVENETHEMWLPVMDGANNAMKAEPYDYTVMSWNDATRKKDIPVKKEVDAATMFDINKTIMRCLTKNLAMFGLGLYIYAGEDLPEQAEKVEVKVLTPEEKQALINNINAAQTDAEVTNAYGVAAGVADMLGDSALRAEFLKNAKERKAALKQMENENVVTQ